MKKLININLLEESKGQITGLKQNPRKSDKKEFERLKQSIKDCPTMLKVRGIIVFPHESKYIIIGGNQRYYAQLELGFTEIHCEVLPKDTSVEVLNEIIIKDNTHTGYWDYEELKNWEEDIEQWGVSILKEIQEEEVKTKKEKTFEDEVNEYNNDNCNLPIVPDFFEKHECFIIPVHNSIDEGFIRDLFDLNTNYISTSGDKKVRKTNVISIENIRKILSNQ